MALFLVLEEFYLAQSFDGLLARLIRPAQISASFLREHIISIFAFYDHRILRKNCYCYIKKCG